MATQHVDRKEFRRVRAETTPKEKGQGPENYIRVTAQRGQRSYISYAIALLKGEEGKEKQDTIKISGMGAAIFNAVNIAEIVKRRVVGLHQTTEIASETVKDSYEGIESKKTLDVERKVATILVTLSTKKLDTKNIGYQAPLPEDQVVEQEERPAREAREPRERGDGEGRRGGRGGRGGRGSSRGSGRGGRGGSRGARGGSRGSGRGGRGAGGADRTERPARGGERGGERGPAREQRTERGPARGGAERGSGRGGSRGSGSPSGSPRGAGAPRGSGRGATRGSGRGGRGRD